MKKNFYFKRDASAFSDAKLMNLIKQEGMTDYGIYWAILEFLRVQHGYTALYVMFSYLSRRVNERMAAHDRVVSSCRALRRLGGLAKSLKISQSDEANALALQRESNHIITSLKSESEANSCSSPEELLRTVAEMKHETIWQEQMPMKSGMRLKFAGYIDNAPWSI